MRVAYVNGDYVPLEEARISILDRGFIFADGVYEVSAVIDGRLVDNEEHLVRLRRSLKEIRLDCPIPLDDIPGIQQELISRNDLQEGGVYLQVTRGPAERDFGFPENSKPSLVLFTQARPVISNERTERGIKVVTVPEIRWKRRDIKSVALLAQVLAKQAAVDAGAGEAWMVEDGLVTEGSSSNAFIITGEGAIVTRKADTSILSGITRKAVLALAEREGMRVEERGFTVAEASRAEEAFLTSASAFVTPIIQVDEYVIGNGTPGPHVKSLRELYLRFAREAT